MILEPPPPCSRGLCPQYPYAGWGVSEKEVQYVIDDGTIELFYNGATRRFGKNIASWDAEEIISRIERFTEHTFNRKTEKDYPLTELEDSHNTIIE